MSVAEILRDLVAFNTVSDVPNVAAIDYLRARLEPAGLHCQRFGDELFQNLIARNDAALAWAEEGRTHLALCAHIDTVPFDATSWSSDPLTLESREGRLYGLGATDMKGPLASMLQAILDQAQISPHVPLALVVTHHEETDFEGARGLIQSAEALAALRSMRLVIGEPTGLRLGYEHRGVYDFSITIEGRAAHSGGPERGLNAIYGAAQVVEAIEELCGRWLDAEPGDADFGNTVSVGIFRGGDARNRVPALAALSGDMRVAPGSNPSRLIETVERRFDQLRDRGFRCELRCDHDAPPFEMHRDQGLIAELAAVTGAEPVRLGYATDAAIFRGLAGIDCAILGPGDIGVCHRPDEYIERSQLDIGVATYMRVLAGQLAAHDGCVAPGIER